MFIKKNILLMLFIVMILLISKSESVYARDVTGLGAFDVEMNFNENKPGLKVSGINSDTKENTWNTILEEYKGIIYVILGLATLTTVALFVINFIKLGTSSGDSSERKKAVRALLWTFVGASALGGLTFILAFFTNLFK